MKNFPIYDNFFVVGAIALNRPCLHSFFASAMGDQGDRPYERAGIK
jgi:hypothetical protein